MNKDNKLDTNKAKCYSCGREIESGLYCRSCRRANRALRSGDFNELAKAVQDGQATKSKVR